MGFGDSSLFVKIEFFLLIFAFLFQVIGLAVPLWYSFTYNSNWSVNSGIWAACVTYFSTSTCSNFNATASWLEATQAFAILGMLALLGALVCVILYMFVMSDKKILGLIAAILSFCGFLFILISICVYAGSTNFSSYHFGFAICIIALIIALVAGILGLLDWMGKGK